MAYQEGQYISQFLNTMPAQLANYAQQQEQIRQFEVSSKERGRQFDALQGLRISADQRAQVEAARAEERYKYETGQAKLIDLLLKNQYAKSIEIAEAEERKTKALEGRKGLGKISQLLPSGVGPKSIIDKLRDEISFGLGREPTSRGQYWSETDQEWAQRITDYDKVGRGPMDLPEGLALNPQLYQYMTQSLSGYQTPLQNLLGLTLQGGGK